MLRKALLVIVVGSLFITNPSAQVVKPLTTDLSQQTILGWMGCEGTNCVGITIDATAGGIGLTSSKYNPVVTDTPSGLSRAQVAVCYNTGAKIWVTSGTGVTLASSRGVPVFDGGVFSIYGYVNISNFKAIRDAAVSSTLFCDYYRQY